MSEIVTTYRFDLENYKNVLVFDDRIIISNNFYQSREHFLNREKNSRRDRVTTKVRIRKITYNSIGKSVTIFSKRRKRKLIFHSSKTRDEFIQVLKPDEFLMKTEADAVPITKIASVLFAFVIIMVVIFYYANLQKTISMERFLFLLLGLVVAVYTFFKKILRSVNISYNQ